MKRKKGANKKQMRRVTEVEKQKIIAMRKDPKMKHTLRQIAGAFGLTNPAVFYILRKAEVDINNQLKVKKI